MVGIANRISVAISFAGGHRSVIMNINNGKVLSSLIKLIQNGTEKVCLLLHIYIPVCEQIKEIARVYVIRVCKNRSYLHIQ